MGVSMSRSFAGIALVVAALLLTSPHPASAGPFGLESLVEANLGCHFSTNPGTNECSDADDPFDAGTRISDPTGNFLSMSWSDAFLLSSLATSEADFGMLRVSASAEFDLPSDDTRFVSASAHTIESLAVVGDDFEAGTPGFMEVSLHLSGTVESTGAGSAGGQFGVFWEGPQGDDGAFDFFFGDVDEVLVFNIPIIAGEEFTLQYFMGVLAGTPVELCDAGEPGCNVFEEGAPPLRFVEVSGQGSGTIDFSHSFELIGLVATDAQGNPIQNPVFRASSGTQYSENGVVPEPASLLLMGSGRACALRRWRRQTSAR